MTRLIRFTVAAVVLCLLWLAMPQHSTVAQTPCPAEVGCAQLSLTPNTLLGDFFLGDQLLAAGQNAPLLQIPPGQNLQIVVRNIQSPGDANFNNLYVYQETTVRVNVAAGKVKPYKATPRKQFIRGTLNFTCDPRGAVAGEDVSCQVIIDGADRGVHPLKKAVPFILDPGSHVVTVQLVGGSAGLWEPNRKEQASRITAGRNTPLRVQFDKRAHLVANLSEPGTVGDFFVNDVLIAGQVPSIDIYVPANVAQRIVVRNINPPPAGTRWLEATSSATIRAGATRTVTLRLKPESAGILTINITEADFERLFRPRPGQVLSDIDIVEGQLIILLEYRYDAELPLLLLRTGVRIENGKVICELVSIEGNGLNIPIGELQQGLYGEFFRSFAELFNRDINQMVQTQIRLKAGSRYTAQSAAFTGDNLVIVVAK